jgi:hypothetical protein
MDQPASYIGAFAVRRGVLDNEGGILRQQKLRELMAQNSAVVMPDINLSLLSPLESKRYAESHPDQASQIRQKLKVATETFPDQLTGFIGRAIIVGRRHPGPGWRAIGYTVTHTIHHPSKRERQQLVSAIDAHEYMRPRFTPHISFFQTRDAYLAEELKDQLEEIRRPRIPLELGPAEVVPVGSRTPLVMMDR